MSKKNVGVFAQLLLQLIAAFAVSPGIVFTPQLFVADALLFPVFKFCTHTSEFVFEFLYALLALVGASAFCDHLSFENFIRGTGIVKLLCHLFSLTLNYVSDNARMSRGRLGRRILGHGDVG